MKAIVNGKIYQNEHFTDGKVLLFDEKIRGIIGSEEIPDEAQIIDAKGKYVVPGFIDVHIHGYAGVDTMDGEISALETISENIVKNGVCAYLPTTMTMEMETIRKALKSIRHFMEIQKKGAVALGAHLEGPFINVKYKGAQKGECIIAPNAKLVEEFQDVIKVITIAPEVEGALDMIEKYSDKICFSIGHTGATAGQAVKGFKVGAKSVTHLFNAMTGIHHREVGVAVAALSGDNYCELIADNIHVNPMLYPLVKKAKGTQKVLLITDCIRAGGLNEGVYSLGGQRVTVKDGVCRLDSGTIAGSVLKLNQGLKNFVEATDTTLEEAVKIVSTNQAKYLSVLDNYGTLDKGKEANIVLLDENIKISKTIVKGEIEYEI